MRELGGTELHMSAQITQVRNRNHKGLPKMALCKQWARHYCSKRSSNGSFGFDQVQLWHRGRDDRIGSVKLNGMRLAKDGITDKVEAAEGSYAVSHSIGRMLNCTAEDDNQGGDEKHEAI